MISLVIGLTGGIGAGKTTTAEILESYGADVVDVDQIGRDLFKIDNLVKEQVVNHFGSDVLAGDGSVDREKLGNIVFSDSKELEALEAISHPVINRILKSRILEQRSQTIVLDMAILVEKELAYDGEVPMYHKVVVVESSRDQRVRRLEKRELTRDEIYKRFDSQASDEERREVADFVIRNDGTLVELKQAMKKMWDVAEIWRKDGRNDCMESETKK